MNKSESLKNGAMGRMSAQTKRYAKAALRLAKRLYQSLPLSMQTKEKHRQWVAKVAPRALLASGAHPSTIPAITIPQLSIVKAANETTLAAAKRRFRKRCQRDLQDFLAGDRKIKFLQPSGKPKVSVVLVLHNQAELTYHCLESLRQNSAMPIELIIFDNDSADETSALLDRLEGVQIIRSLDNRHYVRGVNEAAKLATAEYLLLLNNDTQVLPGTLAAAIACLEEDCSVGAVGGPIVLVNGTLQEAGCIVFSDGSCCGYGRGADPSAPEYRFRREVDYCSAAFLMLRRSLWEALGGFDDAFAPAYYEETDLCERIWALNYRVIYDPNVRIVHFEFGSSDKIESAIQRQKVNAQMFAAKHADSLNIEHFPCSTPAIIARRRRTSTPRILVIDDRVPLPTLGSGYPRAAKYLEVMADIGCAVTLYPTAAPCDSLENAYQIVSLTTELICGGPQASLADFLSARRGCFDAVFVSRPHNLVRFKAALALLEMWDDAPILYDAEAIFAERDATLASLRGDPPRDSKKALQQELALTDGVRTVFAVSPSEASIFRAHGHQDVRLLSHSVRPRPLGLGPEHRANLLFVGALSHEFSPNTDSLHWFVKEIMPKIDAAMGSEWSLDIVGECSAPSLKKLRSERIRFHGMIQNIDHFYAGARVFIAPTRYAAGIPLKVVESASVGLPVVATEILAKQLGWVDGHKLQVASDSEAYAQHCVRLYQDAALWWQQREAALTAVTNDFPPEGFKESLRRALRDLRGAAAC